MKSWKYPNNRHGRNMITAPTTTNNETAPTDTPVLFHIKKGDVLLTDTLKKHIFRLLAYALILAPLTVTGDDCMNIDEAVFAEHTRPFVCFVHDEHNEDAGIEECEVCHHVYEDGKLMPGETSEDMACSECHGAKDDPKQFKLIATYHNRCRSCHLDREKGPVTCGGCHEKSK